MAYNPLGSLLDRDFRNSLNGMLLELYEGIDTASVTKSKIDSFLAGENVVSSKMLANGSVTGSKLGTRSVTWDKLDEGAVTGSRIADDAVSSAKIQNGSVYGDKITDGGIGTRHLLSNTVSTPKIQDGAVTNSKLGLKSITWDKFDDGAVTYSKIRDSAVVNSKIQDGAVTNSKIEDSAVTNTKIGDKAIHNRNIADLAVRENHIAGLNVTEGKLASNSVTANKIASGAVTNSKIGDNSIHARNIADIQVGERHIAGMSVTESKLANYAVTGFKIADNAVGNRSLGDNAVHHRNIANFAVREGHLAADTVKGVNIIDNSISRDKIADGAVTGEKISVDSLQINKGKEYPLLITKLDGETHPLTDEVKNVVLSAKVIGARKDKFYAIQYIANGLSEKYGITLAEYDRDDEVGLDGSTRRVLIEFGDEYFNHEVPEGDIVHRTIHIPNENLSFEIVYDRSEITGYTFGLNFSNTTEGKARSSVIHPANYVYRMESESTETIISSNSGKVFMDKKTDRFFVYKPVSNGNYIGHEITHYVRGVDPENKLSNYDLWCVRTIKEYSRSGNTFTPVRSFIDDSTPTTMDLMIKESIDMDYMGGIHHGDEVSDFTMLLADGKPIDLSSTGFYEAKEIRLVQRNKLYRDSVYTGGVLEHLGTVGKEHVFNYVDGYTLHNTVTWHESINIYQAFLGSLSLYRKDEKGNSPLWHTAINDITHTPYDLTTVGGQMSTATDVERVIILGEKVSCIVEVDRLDNIPGNPTWVANFADHNSKLYISYVPNGYTTEVDEVWKQSTKFNFELGD